MEKESFYHFLQETKGIRHLSKQKLTQVFLKSIRDKQRDQRVSLENMLPDKTSECSKEQDLKCSICLDLFILPSTMQCGHTFCKQCVQQVFFYKKVCPICRKITRIYKVLANNSLQSIIDHYITTDDTI